jgi:hypothetical protein
VQELYQRIDLNPLEHLSRNINFRLAYVSPKIGEQWRAHVLRHQVRLCTVDADVMTGRKAKMQPSIDLQDQSKFWYWIRGNLDFRIHANK